ncbi:MAG: hypothetical protein MJZ34_08705, partial [Paludibacteraceae bacterium]|nr:hypothetical protein [Paludibacteraceae bacterium]
RIYRSNDSPAMCFRRTLTRRKLSKQRELIINGFHNVDTWFLREKISGCLCGTYVLWYLWCQ